jgi:hypothetical protein
VSKRTPPLKAPFPWPGGKSRVADLVWERLGNVGNFCEPFAGSLAVTLRRPADHFEDGYRVETVNDANHYIVNFWRAVRQAPDEVAEYADWPVTEADLHARHKWLVRSAEAAKWRAKMVTDADHFDAKVAGWWTWGQCCWIGGAWCAHKVDQAVLPLLDSSQKGVHSAQGENPADWVQAPELASGMGRGDAAAHADGADNHKRPHIGATSKRLGSGVAAAGPAADHEQRRPLLAMPESAHGCGVNGSHGRPQLADAFDIGRGVNSGGNLSQQVPLLRGRPGNSGTGVTGAAGLAGEGTVEARRAWLTDWMNRLADRLRLVRTCYGHWSRVCDSDSTLTRLGLTGVFLDPPYPARSVCGKKSRDPNLYATDAGADLDGLRDEVLAWCRKWGDDRQIRIAVCGYEGDGYEALESLGWTVHSWEASGGYANQRRAGKGKSENAARERIWFSPGCKRPVECPLFDHLEPA